MVTGLRSPDASPAGTTRTSTAPATSTGWPASRSRSKRGSCGSRTRFDAITHTRPYRQARLVEEALEALERFAGRQCGPELVRLLVELVRSGRLEALSLALAA